MLDAYITVKSISFTETADGPGSRGMPYRMEFAYQRPDQIEVRVTRNGNTTRIVYQNSKVYSIPEEAPGKYQVQDITSGNTPMTTAAVVAANIQTSPALATLD